jgi:selenocysteine lyase/cysteine desulfurase
VVARCFEGEEPASFGRLVALMRQARPDGTAGAVRVSVGPITTFADVQRFLSFARGFLNASALTASPEGPGPTA